MAEEIKAITGSLSSMIDSIGTVTDNLDQVDNSSLNNLKKSVSQACNEIDQIANVWRSSAVVSSPVERRSETVARASAFFPARAAFM